MSDCIVTKPDNSHKNEIESFRQEMKEREVHFLVRVYGSKIHYLNS